MPSWSRLSRKHETWLLLVTVTLAAALSIISPAFFTLRNAQDLITANAFTSILAAGLLLVLISGGIDISFTATATVAQYIAMTVANAHNVGWIGVILIASAAGIALGLVNAVLIHVFRVPSIIATLGTLNAFYGLLVFVTRGNYIYTLPDWFELRDQFPRVSRRRAELLFPQFPDDRVSAGSRHRLVHPSSHAAWPTDHCFRRQP